MASNTSRLDLLKKNPSTDGNDTFNIETMLNENWEKIDKSTALIDPATGKLLPGQENPVDTSNLATKTELNNKVDKIAGKSLSTNDYTTAEKNKLTAIESGAQVNAVTTVAGRTGAVVLTKTDVGLSNVDNVKQASKVEHDTLNGTVTTHLADEAAHGIGDKATLLTTNKASIVGALNELFTNANSLKSDWAGVVGSPLLANDTSAQMKSKTQTIKNTLATNLSAKGQSSSGTEALTALVNKVANVNTGKKFATGTTAISKTSVNVTGLSFRPTIIVLLLDSSGDNDMGGMYVARNEYGNLSMNNINFYRANNLFGLNPFTVTSNGFSFLWGHSSGSGLFRWIAIE